MKTLQKKHSTKSLDSIFIKDESLNRFKGKDLFPEKTQKAKETFKTMQLPPR